MPKKVSKLEKMRAGAQALLDESAPVHEIQATKWRRFAHFWVLVGRSFARNRCPVRASALAYASLLALIPMLAVVVSVSSTFLKKEGENRIDEFITKLVSSVPPPATINTNSAASSGEASVQQQGSGPKTEPVLSPDLADSKTAATANSDG